MQASAAKTMDHVKAMMEAAEEDLNAAT